MLYKAFQPGLINVDFADVKTVMLEMGMAMMGSATATGPDRAIDAVHGAVSSPLLEDVDIYGARGLLVNVSAGPDMTLDEYAHIGEVVSNYASEDATVVIGTTLDSAMEGDLRVTMVATGIRKGTARPDVHLVKEDAGGNAPEEEPFPDLDTPTVIRRRSQASGLAEGNAAVDMDYLDIPAFLRRQAE